MNATRTDFVASPLNYTGGKYRLLPQIFPLFPTSIDRAVDLFCGGCNVGINIQADKVDFYDKNQLLLDMFRTFQNLGGETVADMVGELVEHYHLSDSATYGYSHYRANSSKGLGDVNREKFLRLRQDFNQREAKDYQYFVMLYVLIIFSFNNQIRFNANGKFNLPVGKRDFNKKMKEKLLVFSEQLDHKKHSFIDKDFREVDFSNLTDNSFVYVDPPYLITCATYNEQGGWGDSEEKDLLDLLDELSERNIRFALSNVLESKGKTNEILLKWTNDNANRYQVHDLSFSYANSNYQTKGKESPSREVLITNHR